MNICRRKRIVCADVKEKVEMCADEMPPRAWNKVGLRRCLLRVRFFCAHVKRNPEVRKSELLRSGYIRGIHADRQIKRQPGVRTVLGSGVTACTVVL